MKGCNNRSEYMKKVPRIPTKPTGEVKTQAMYLRKRLILREYCDRLGLGRDCKLKKDIRYCKSHGCEVKNSFTQHREEYEYSLKKNKNTVSKRKTKDTPINYIPINVFISRKYFVQQQ